MSLVHELQVCPSKEQVEQYDTTEEQGAHDEFDSCQK